MVCAEVGHGVGAYLHQPPSLTLGLQEGEGPVIRPGLILTVEPIVARDPVAIRHSSAGLVRTAGPITAQCEVTVMVTEEGPLVLTPLPMR